jgi:NAD+ synthase (glutamine-hydrolysing)
MSNKKAKIALASPKIKLCNPEYNAELFIESARCAEGEGADIIVFPELALTGATAGDLFMQDALTESVEKALCKYVRETAELEIMSFVGLPIRAEGSLYNAVAVISEGEVLGVTASGLSSRQFSAIGKSGVSVTLAGQEVSVARNHIYTDEATGTDIFVKIGDDDAFTDGGVNLILNPASAFEYIGLQEQRREYAREISSALGVTFAIVSAGEGESTTDGISSGARLIAHGGELLCESDLFSADILYAELPVRSGKKKFTKPEAKKENETVKFPFIPEGEEEKRSALELAVAIQSRALALRIERAYAKTAVIGVSGGIDSTLAVLVAAYAMDILGRGRDSVIAITMPCFGTTERTKSNATALAEELGCTVRTIDIKASVNQHFADISHDKNNYDVVYENAQARERTQILMDIANATGGLVVGTGDLSELALGFATYNGDHMSMYSVNASVPKTLMREIIRHEAGKAESLGKSVLSKALLDIVNTPVSPELLPIDDSGANSQHTESIIGPYELHDFFLYYTVKYGYSPKKILSLARETFTEYSPEEIEKYLSVFVRRFFTQQFKRSCMPDGPQVTEITLSPRGAWIMPSDISIDVWKNNLAGKE